jgi:putative copper resistance protein D
VLFTLPDSLARLEEIDRVWMKIGLSGARVIAVPMRNPEETYRRLGTRLANPAIAVEGSDEIVAAYTRLAQLAASVRATARTHMEFLIDRQGWVRARWILGEEPAWSDLPVLLAEVERLDKKAPAAPPPEDHVH